MKLSAKILKNVIDINHFQYASEAVIVEGQSNDIYIQLIDKGWSLNPKKEHGVFLEHPIRYISQATVIAVKANFFSIDDSQEFEITATQPFSDDKSIYKISLTSSQIPNAGNFKITLTEDSIDKVFIVKQGIVLELINDGSC